MKVQTQFSVFLVNKPGVLAQVFVELAEAKINITALTLADTTEHGVLRLVTTAPERTRLALARVNVPTTETNILAASIPNRPGAMADVCDRLAAAHINISYAYCTSGAPGNKTMCILKVADPKKAVKVLATRSPRRKVRLANRPNPARAR